MTAVEISFGNDALELQLSAGADQPLVLSGLSCHGTAFKSSGVPLVEIFTPDAGHYTPTQRLTKSLISKTVRYRCHVIEESNGWHHLDVELVTVDDQLRVDLRLSLADGVAAVRSTVTVTAQGSEQPALTCVPSLSLGVTGGFGTTELGAADLDLVAGANDWLGESRWLRRPVRDTVVDLSHRGESKDAHVARSLGTWSTARDLPTGALVARDDSFAFAWQIEHNGGWRWEVADDGAALSLTLSGPTDVDHQWLQVLAPGESFTTVPATVAVGAGFEDAMASLTHYRRAARRPHPDNEKLTLVYNDYMNTLSGDPTTERLLPLIDEAARAGAEAFCIDAGWYDDGSNWWDSVGAWLPSPSRFPGGLAEVIERIRSHGMVPGLWLEPEVVGVRSPVADTLPAEAFLSRGGRRVREAGRFHLDLSHPAARQHLNEVVDRLVSELGIGFFKMDYNINPGAGTDRAADSAGAGLLRHSRAVLSWLEEVYDRHPELIIENCGSGAMRSDFAMLSRLQLQSTSDQQNAATYAPIAAAAPMMMLPEQAGSWAYPSVEMDDEETVFSLSLGLLGRLYLSGYLNRLRPEQVELVHQGVAAHKRLRNSISTRDPIWPLGLPHWDATWLALGLADADSLYLTLWRRDGASSELEVSLPQLVGGNVTVELVFPTTLQWWANEWDAATGTLRLQATGAGPSARTYLLRRA